MTETHDQADSRQPADKAPPRRSAGRIPVNIGLRTVKSLIAVGLCCLASYWAGVSPFYAAIAAMMVMQQTHGDTRKNAKTRTLGTFVGGSFSLIILYLDRGFLMENRLVHYAIVTLFIIPIVLFTLMIKRPNISYFSCVVFFSITLAHYQDENPFYFVIYRVLLTLFGIFIALLLNGTWLPRHRNRDHLFVLDDQAVSILQNNKREQIRLNRLREEGCQVTYQTDWTPAAFAARWPQLPLNLPFLALNGAVLFDPLQQSVLDAIPFDPVSSAAIQQSLNLALAQKQVPGYFAVLLSRRDLYLSYWGDSTDSSQYLIQLIKCSRLHHSLLYQPDLCGYEVLSYLLLAPEPVIADVTEPLLKLPVLAQRTPLDLPDQPGLRLCTITSPETGGGRTLAVSQQLRRTCKVTTAEWLLSGNRTAAAGFAAASRLDQTEPAIVTVHELPGRLTAQDGKQLLKYMERRFHARMKPDTAIPESMT